MKFLVNNKRSLSVLIILSIFHVISSLFYSHEIISNVQAQSVVELKAFPEAEGFGKNAKVQILIAPEENPMKLII